MLNRYFGENTHTYLHLLGLSGLAAGIPLNKVVMSVSMMFILLNLILEGDFNHYIKRLRSNPLFLGIALFFGLHLVGLLWSENQTYGWHDIRVKLPLLVVAIALAAKPVAQPQHLRFVLGVFVASVLLTSLLNYAYYQHWLGQRDYDDIRGMSLFSSHVRYGIIVSLATGILVSELLQRKSTLVLLLVIPILWLCYYTFYSQVLSGVITLLGVFLVLFIHLFWRRYRWIVLSFLTLIGLVGIALVVWLQHTSPPKNFDLTQLPTHTREGNPYIHYNKLISPETGKPLYIFLNDEELDRDWSKYSSVPIDSLDKKGQPIKFTLLRYLASKDYPKDAEGLARLTPREIKDIEYGIGSYQNRGLVGRLYGIKFQLINNENPNHHSLLERLEYWKTGLKILQKNLIFGVGTGDVQDAFNQQYEEDHSPLILEKRKRAHNMFLTFAITFGIIGLILFLLLNGFYIKNAIQNQSIVALLFITIALLSFLMEDTLETQTGVTFYAFFFALYMQLPQQKPTTNPHTK